MGSGGGRRVTKGGGEGGEGLPREGEREGGEGEGLPREGGRGGLKRCSDGGGRGSNGWI